MEKAIAKERQATSEAVDAQDDYELGDDIENIDRLNISSWEVYAACKGANLDIFFSDNKNDVAAAKAVCQGCPVAQQCLEYSLIKNEELGVWGGKTADERRTIKRRIRLGRVALNR